MERVAYVSAHHLDERRIALGRPNCRNVADDPEGKPRDPQAKPETDRSRERTVEDGNGAWCASQQDRLGQRAVDRRFEAGDQIVVTDAVHYTSAPPANEKNDRKKDDAANAIERPKTICMRRRKPPAMSPKASVRPVTMMMITAMILETGPSIDCRICWSGCSQGMFDPAAKAGMVGTMIKVATANMLRWSRTNGRIMCGLPRIRVRLQTRGRNRRPVPKPRREQARSVDVRNRGRRARQ